MNYYERHLGDYAKDTAHLSMLEHGAYTLLLDRYYATEQGIPADQAHRVARARTKEEKEAVDVVLQEFFRLEDGVWVKGRVEEEIASYLESLPAAEERKKGAKERQQRARERRRQMFEELAKYGVVMPWNTKTETLQAELLRVTSQAGHTRVTPPVTRDNTATHTPDTSPHIKDIAAAATSSTTVDPAEASPPAPPGIEKSGQPLTAAGFAVLLRQWEKERGKACRTTSSDPRLTVWAEKDVNEVQLREAYDLAVADRDDKGDVTPINAGFLDAMLAKVLNPPTGDSALNRQASPGIAKHWGATWSGIVAKGADLGIEQGPDETPPAFKARVFAAAKLTADEKAVLRADYGVSV
jgi:uncharacterized protein YdaU (DUF1376 family)